MGFASQGQQLSTVEEYTIWCPAMTSASTVVETVLKNSVH